MVADNLFYLQKKSNSYFIVFLLFMYGMVLWSPIVTRVFNFEWEYSTIIIILSLSLWVLLKKRRIKMWVIYISLLLLIFASIPAFYWSSLKFIFYPINLVLALYLVSSSTYNEIELFIDVSTYFLLIVLVGAVIGFYWAQIGLPPLYEFYRGEGNQILKMYGPTITHHTIGNFIRPGGIYTEAGAFSLVICLISFMRKCLNKDFRVTWFLLILGFITFSLAHLIFVTFFILSEIISLRRLVCLLLVVITILFISFVTNFHEYIESKLFQRLVVTEEGKIAGDNRSERFINAWNVLRSEGQAWLVGIGPTYTFDRTKVEPQYERINENPLTDLTAKGIFIAWPNYIFLFLFFFFTLSGKINFASFAVFLIFMQRPHIDNHGTSLLFVLAIFVQLFAMNTKNRLPFFIGKLIPKRY